MAVYGLSLVSLSCGASAQSHYPLCPTQAAQQPLPVIHTVFNMQVPLETRRAALLEPREDLTFEMRTLPTGQIACISPILSLDSHKSFSLLWPLAIEAIDREFSTHPLPAQAQRVLIVLPNPLPKEVPRGGIIVVPNLSNIQPGGLSDPEVPKLACDSTNVGVLLAGVARAYDNMELDFTFNSYTKQMECANAAVSLEPGSLGLQYLAGMANDDRRYTRPFFQNHPRNLNAAIEHYRAALNLDPDFYEARQHLAEALQDSGALAEAEKEYLHLAQTGNPPEIQQEAEESLKRLYDEMKDPPRALLAARRAEQLIETLSSLSAGNHNFELSRSDLAAREEEAGQYAQAASDYRGATSMMPKDDLQANFYEYDLGRARSLRESGDASSAEVICNGWRRRVFGLHQKLNLSQWWEFGGGLDVEQARWEFSCGDFNKGVRELFQIANSRVDHPVLHKDWKDEPTQMFLMEPYDALASAFRYRRLSEAARQALAISRQAYNIDHGVFDFEPN